MKWMGAYLVGYFILLLGILGALWKLGILERLGAGWTVIGLTLAAGLGVILAVANSGTRQSIEIDK